MSSSRSSRTVGLELAAQELPLVFQVRTGFAASDQNLSVVRHGTGRDDYRSTFGLAAVLEHNDNNYVGATKDRIGPLRRLR